MLTRALKREIGSDEKKTFILFLLVISICSCSKSPTDLTIEIKRNLSGVWNIGGHLNLESVIFESFSWGNSMRNINSVSIDLLAEKPYISAHGGKLSVIKSKNHGNGIYSFELEDPRKKFIGTLRLHYEIKGKAVWFEDFSQNMLWSVSYGEKRLYFKVGGPSTN